LKAGGGGVDTSKKLTISYTGEDGGGNPVAKQIDTVNDLNAGSGPIFHWGAAGGDPAVMFANIGIKSGTDVIITVEGYQDYTFNSVSDTIDDGTGGPLDITLLPALSQIDWLLSQQNNLTGLVDSYEGDGTNNAYTYDQALAVIAFTASKNIQNAKNILDRYNTIQNPDGSWYQCYLANNANNCNTNKWAGDIAWLVMAINYYEHETKDNSYADMASDALAFLDTLRDTNPVHDSYGAFVMYPGSTAYSTENNYDIYSAFHYRGLLENNVSYLNIANLVKEYIITEMWAPSTESDGPFHNVGVFWVGFEAYGWYTDPPSWAVLALGSYGPNAGNFTQKTPTL
jgi:hypothetical protein